MPPPSNILKPENVLKVRHIYQAGFILAKEHLTFCYSERKNLLRSSSQFQRWEYYMNMSPPSDPAIARSSP